jgi:hypothetical protein
MGMGAIRHCIRRVGGLVGILLLVGTAGAARAQTLSGYFPEGVPGFGAMPGVTVLSRTRPDYTPQGIQVDDFLVSPSFEESAGYDSNVLGGPGSPGSWTLGTHPSVRVASDWSRDAVAGVLDLNDTRYLDSPQQSRTDGSLVMGGTKLIGRDALTVGFAYMALHEDRTALDAVPSDTPVGFTLADARVDYTVALDRLSLTPNLEVSEYNYDNTTIMGVPANQAYRNRAILAGGLTARYELMPLQDLVLVLRGTGTNYLDQQVGQPTRNSTGALVLVGLSDDSDAVWRYRLLVGWEERHFAAGAYSAHAAPVAEAEAIWSPSGLTTVTGRLTRSIEDAAQEGVSGYTYTAAGLTLDHEYRRDILLQATGGLQRADFLQGGGTQTALLFGLGVTWLVDRQMRVSATYSYGDQQGGGVGTAGPFGRSLGLLTVRYGW